MFIGIFFSPISASIMSWNTTAWPGYAKEAKEKDRTMRILPAALLVFWLRIGMLQ